MTDQFSIFDDRSEEQKFFDAVAPAFDETLFRNNAPAKNAGFEILKNGTGSYTYRSSLVFRIKCGAKVKWLELPAGSKKVIDEGFELTEPKNGYVRIDISQSSDPVEYSALLAGVLDYVIDTAPTSFDCCSRYLECSNAKRCVNPNQDLAMDCSYRSKLKQGLIFYGENSII